MDNTDPPFPLEAETSLLPSHIIASPSYMSNSELSIVLLEAQLKQIEALEAPAKDLLEHLKLVQQHCRRERRQATQYLRDHQSIIAPIRRVPDDILVEIFLVFMNTGSYNFGPDPITLTGVCGRWRTLAQATTCLWSQITVHLTPSNHLSMGHLIHHHAALSAHRPLTLNLTPKRYPPSNPAVNSSLSADGKGEDDQLLAKALASSAARWQTVEVTPSTLQYLYNAWSIDKSNWKVPLLESFALNCVDDSEDWPPYRDLDMFA